MGLAFVVNGCQLNFLCRLSTTITPDDQFQPFSELSLIEAKILFQVVMC
jgi:hypothetical protein